MKKWNKLDNAAKIFPSSIEQSETRVFRVYGELKEAVDPVILQHALDRTIQEFPQFLRILRKGLFWYYLEYTRLKPMVKEETESPCPPIYKSGQHNLLFQVTYYKKRINLDIFHALADGAGALSFLRYLLTTYLKELYPGTIDATDESICAQGSVLEMDEDSFETYYTGEKNSASMPKRSHTVWLLRRKRRPDLDINVTEGIVSASEVLELAHCYQATLTEFLVAVFMKALICQMSDRDLKKTLVLDIPINLRNFFPSETTRNFFAILPISYQPVSREDSLEMICKEVCKKFETIITKENLTHKINSLGGFERVMAMRLVPLFIKDPGLRFFNFLAKRFVTGCFSNLGRVTLPYGCCDYVTQIGVYSSTNTVQAECCSYKDKLVLGFSDAFTDIKVITDFFELLRELGISAVLQTNSPEAISCQFEQGRVAACPNNPGNSVNEALTTNPDADCTAASTHKQAAKNTTEKKKQHQHEKTCENCGKKELYTSLPINPNGRVFPVVPEKKRTILNYLQLINKLSIAAMIAYALIYIFTGMRGFWLAIMCINTFFIWNGICTGILSQTSILRKLFSRFLWTSIFYLALDIFSGWNQWSITQQLPTFALINILLSFYMAAIFDTDTADEELSLYLSMDAMMGVVPGVLILFGVVEAHMYPLVVSVICLIFLLMMILFRWHSLTHEYKKAFHI